MDTPEKSRIDIPHSEYRTKDFGESIALLSSNLTIKKLEPDSHGFYWFIFESRNIQSIVDKYWKNQLYVDAKTHFEKSKQLKAIIYTQNKLHAGGYHDL